ncbi:TonB-dependent receptor [Antarcticibacterium arcticum]|uniref:TonB-dependent receptor n=1 Tax=Antarcticibacterium arcticum TaxID=2585771 RepID=A0A5B8YHS7_9FLAO|nr:TonB-dependent receptor [Antarcticibacterium arcticum]QED37500.1 TonB-dependent receptor [Antarcticibacterium arcticum]
MKHIIISGFLFLNLFSYLHAQNIISGVVGDTRGNPVFGANVYLHGTYDGATTLEDGSFIFSSSQTGTVALVVSYLSYREYRREGTPNEFVNINITLREDLNSLDAVVISAGTFNAGEKARVSVLKPLDIVTTAGSAGDIIAALQTLPGTQNVGESGRLFVRGGDAGETQTFVDGLRVPQPYTASVQNLPSRGRFSPFLFSGISFSTGGYSAEYGDALSSVLLLETRDRVEEEKTEISLMSVGISLGHIEKWDKRSLNINTSYINLAPYQVLVPENLDWNKAYESLAGEAIYRQEFKNGLWKVYTAFDAAEFDFNRENIDTALSQNVKLKNKNFYLNTSYRGTIWNNWQLFTGISQGHSENLTSLDERNIENQENAFHFKANLGKRISNGVRLVGGIDYFRTGFEEVYSAAPSPISTSGFNLQQFAAFAEADVLFSRNLAAKVGLRYSYYDEMEEAGISPRISAAYRINENAQLSAAMGKFVQSPGQDYLKFTSDICTEEASHFILNFQYQKERRLLRAEIFQKDYSNLIKFETGSPGFNNNGSAYARGLDLFWRDDKTIKNLEYWFSYSFIDTKRDYRDYREKVTPYFVAPHSASLVTKYWVQAWRSQMGFSYNYSAGRPFNDPNTTQFMSGRTKDFNNLSFNWAYLLSSQKILYFSVSNVLGHKNIFGYEYAGTRDLNGNFRSRAITPTADRFFFVGFFWTLSDNKASNQLENL